MIKGKYKAMITIDFHMRDCDMSSKELDAFRDELNDGTFTRKIREMIADEIVLTEREGTVTLEQKLGVIRRELDE